MNVILVNGKMQKGAEPALLVSNRGYRYGDGLFETMRLSNGKIHLQELHFDRLGRSMDMLGYGSLPGFFETLPGWIADLARENQCHDSARVRLSVYRGNGDLDSYAEPGFVIECFSLAVDTGTWNQEGMHIGLYTAGRKSNDKFSNLKSASAIIYSEAARFAALNGFDDCLLLNCRDTVADATIANVFIVKDGKIWTPGLDQGCVDGVMRRFLIQSLKNTEFEIAEKTLSVENIADAEECFLTNAIRGLRWVARFQDSRYQHRISREIYDRLFGKDA